MSIPKVYLYNPPPIFKHFYTPEDVLVCLFPPSFDFLIVMPEPAISGPNKISHDQSSHVYSGTSLSQNTENHTYYSVCFPVSEFYLYPFHQKSHIVPEIVPFLALAHLRTSHQLHRIQHWENIFACYKLI